MEKRSLKGQPFRTADGSTFRILEGEENACAVFVQEEVDNAPLFFCCDAQLTDRGLKGSYVVSYAVTLREFLAQAEKAFDGGEASGEAEILGRLREKYYKIPKAFLSLVARLALDEKSRRGEKRGKREEVI